MTNGEMIEILEYELDRMKDERGSDYSGVRALEQLLSLLTKDHQNENDTVTETLLRECRGEAELYNNVSRKLSLLYGGRMISASMILLCTYIVKKIREVEK